MSEPINSKRKTVIGDGTVAAALLQRIKLYGPGGATARMLAVDTNMAESSVRTGIQTLWRRGEIVMRQRLGGLKRYCVKR